MAKVIIQPEESFEHALKRFNSYVQRQGILNDSKKNSAFRSKHEKIHERQRKKKK